MQKEYLKKESGFVEANACCLNASAYLNENPQGPHKYVCSSNRGSSSASNLLLWSEIFGKGSLNISLSLSHTETDTTYTLGVRQGAR